MPGIWPSSTTSSNGSPARAAACIALSADGAVGRALAGDAAARRGRPRMISRLVALSSTTRTFRLAGQRARRGSRARHQRLVEADGEGERAARARRGVDGRSRRPSARPAGARSPGRGRCRRSGGWSRCRPGRRTRRACRSALREMPMPVSVTSKRTRRAFASHPHLDLAGLGELDGVAEQVGEHLAQAAAVAGDHRRDVGVDPGHQLQALAVRLRREHLARVLDRVAQVEVVAGRARACRPRSWRSRGCR